MTLVCARSPGSAFGYGKVRDRKVGFPAMAEF